MTLLANLPTYSVEINSVAVTFAEVEYELEPRDISNPPKFRIVLPNRFGTLNASYLTGSTVEIKRNGTTVFKGIVEPRTFKMDAQSSTMEIEGTNLYYRILTNFICDSYDFQETASDYGTTINPWKFGVYRSIHPSHPLQDITLVGPPVHGFRPDEVLKHIIGTKFLYAHKFDDLSHLIPVTTKTSTAYAQVYRNPNFSDQTSPRLQLTYNGASGASTIYNTTAAVESVPLMNGDPNLEVMGDISAATVKLYGVIPSGCTVQVDVCRDGGQTFSKTNNFLTQRSARTWVALTAFTSANAQTQFLDYTDRNGTIHNSVTNPLSVTYWSDTATFSGIEAHKNSLAYRITITGNTTTTPYLEYISFDATTATDTTITAGTIDTYTDADSISGSVYFEGSVESQRRLEAIKNVRLSTINTDDALNHFWDTWINTSGALNFKQRRGTDLTTPIYSFENSKISGIEYKYDGDDIWWKCIAYGAGSGEFRTRIISAEEFVDGGLTKQAVKTTYGNAARVGEYTDGNSQSVSQLLRKARVVFKLHQAPFETLELPGGLIASSTLAFGVGDSIPVEITDLAVDKNFPVESLKFKVDGNGEKVSVVLGEPITSLASAIAGLSSNNEQVYVVRQPTGTSMGNTGAGTYFDKDHYGVFTFGITEPDNIKRVALKGVTVPFDGTVRTSKTGSAHTHAVTGITLAAGGGGVFDAATNTSSATGTAAGQGLSNPGTNVAAGQSLSNPGTNVAAAQTINGSVATPSTITANLLYSITDTSITVSSGTTDTTSLSDTSENGEADVADLEGLVFKWGIQSDTASSVWRVEPFITVDGVNDISLGKHHIDNLDSGETTSDVIFIPSSFIAALGFTSGSYTSARIELRNVGGSSQTLATDNFMNIYGIPKHTHSSTGLSNTNSNISGTAAGSNISGTGAASNMTLTAAFTSLLSSLRLGYRLDSGGTGANFVQNSTTYYEEHNHPVSGSALSNESAHTHGMKFGIFMFSGDSDTAGNGPAFYASGVELWIDPTDETTPESGAKIPTLFGSTTVPVELDELDITSWLKRDANGIITRGIHKVFVKTSGVVTNNTKGLGKIQLVVLDERKEV